MTPRATPEPAPRLLVVDDEPESRLVLERGLARRGYAIDTAADGSEALEKLSRAEYDLVLLDCMMPGMTGLELLRLLRGTRSGAELPVILVTGVDDHEAIVAALDEGANDYVVKPVETAEMSARVQAQLKRARMRKHAPAAAGADWRWDAATGRVEYSAAWAHLAGLPEAPGESDLELWLGRIHPQDLLRVRKELRTHLDGASPEFRSEHRLRHESGEYRWVECRAAVRRDAAGRVCAAEGAFFDITERKRRDPLTGLANRTHLMERLATAHPGEGVLVLLDLDGFAALNQSLGSPGADEMLMEVAARLRDAVARRACGTGAVVARLAGDEFAVLARCGDDAGEFARALLATLDAPVPLEDESVQLSACAGLTPITPGCSPDELLRRAALALRDAQRQGHRHVQIFDAKLESAVQTRTVLSRDLRFAPERRQLLAVYQPVVDLRTGHVRGFEALLRWRHPELGLVSPADFIPLAEQSGLIIPIGEWILREACQQLRSWQRTFSKPLRISVNVSPRQLADPHLPDAVRGALRDAGVDPQNVALELTESSLIEDTPAVRETLNELHRLGLRLLLDDFGTGYAGLSYLNALHFDGVKIDRSFVMHMDTDSGSQAIVRTMAQLARDLRTEAIAEGVETSVQRRLLVELGIETGQGFLFSKPVPANEAGQMLHRGTLLAVA